jgi:large subunit ribosomal protein L16
MKFIPKKTKYKKCQKNQSFNKISSTYSINYFKPNVLYLKAISHGVINTNQLLALKFTVNKIIKRIGKLKICIFPHISITKKPVEVRMGKGKGNVADWIFKTKIGSIICEIETPLLKVGLKALKSAQFRLPVRTKIFTSKYA